MEKKQGKLILMLQSNNATVFVTGVKKDKIEHLVVPKGAAGMFIIRAHSNVTEEKDGIHFSTLSEELSIPKETYQKLKIIL